MKLAVVSTYPPRRCGIAAFTNDLRQAMRQATGWEVIVCALDRDGLRYGPEVDTVIRQYDAEDYRRAARRLADTDVDLVVIEHEFGIFGGPDGAFVLELVDELRLRGLRYAVTLHTVLSRPNHHQRAVLRALCASAALVTVFTEDGKRLALATGLVPASRIEIIPHGAPVILRQPVPRNEISPAIRDLLHSLGRSKLVTTFGLVSPGKGLEHGVRAIAEVASRHADVHYLIAGATHPDVLRQYGERYRDRLPALTEELGIADRVTILDAYLAETDLSAVLARTDLFLTPYRSPEQICSGVLTFALAAGKPVVSTSYRYAVEMLTARDTGTAPGLLVPCGDPSAIAAAVTALLSDPPALANARESAVRLGRTLIWPSVAGQYASHFMRACAVGPRLLPRPRPVELVVLSHLERLIGDSGITQFAKGIHPDPSSGHCVDDMARLAIVASKLGSVTTDHLTLWRWLNLSLAFLSAATQADGMHNMRDADGRWRDTPHVGDHVGRAIWAAANVTAAAVPMSIRLRALDLLRRLVPMLNAGASLRSHAYGLLGVTRWPAREFEPLMWTASARLVTAGNPSPLWTWFEPSLTYDNARLSEALIAAGMHQHNEEMVDRGLSTLDWYLRQVGLTGDNPVLRLVGNGWRAAEMPGPSAHEGDEQPIDAAAVAEALTLAWRCTGERRYATLARRAFDWFHGVNRANAALYDPDTGGCRDGLGRATANENQGAESTLAYYQALLTLGEAGLVLLRHEPPQPVQTTALPGQLALSR